MKFDLFEDFYEEFEEFENLEDINTSYPLECVACKEPLFLTYPSTRFNKEIIEKVVEILKERGVKKEILKKIDKLKKFPLCRWDLFIIIGEILKNEARDKELGNYFLEKIVECYDFDNPKNLK